MVVLLETCSLVSSHVCAFEKFFDGSGSVVPVSHPTMDMSIFPMLGKILSHGYIACGFLPVHISFPVIAAVLLGPDVKISDTILCRSFITYLSYHDACILKSAFSEIGSKAFSCNLQSSLMILLSKYGCRQVPSLENVKSLVTKVARHTFVVKPLASLYAMLCYAMLCLAVSLLSTKVFGKMLQLII